MPIVVYSTIMAPQTTSRSPEQLAKRMSRECTASRLRMLTRNVTRCYDRALTPLGITANQLNVLAVVVGTGGIGPGRLGEVLDMEKSTISRTIARMDEHDWVRINPGSDDRSKKIAPTAKGRKMLLKAEPAWRQAQRDAAAILGPETVSSILTAPTTAKT